MNIFPTDAPAEVVEPEYTPEQVAFMEALEAGKMPMINHYFTINHYFNLTTDGEFAHIDTFVAYKIFEAGYKAKEAQDELVKGTIEDAQFEDEVLAAVYGRSDDKPKESGKLKDWAIMVGILIIGLIIGYYVNFAHLNSKIHF